MFADVLVEYGVKSLDRTFTYRIPKRLKNLQIGMKVYVSFGKKQINGFVINIKDFCDVENIKEIIDIVDPKLILNDELLKLGKYLNEITLCSLINAYQTMLPSSLKIKEQKSLYQLYDEYIEIIDQERAAEFIANNNKKRKQIEILYYIMDNNRVLKQDYSSVLIKNLIDEKIVKIVKVEKKRINPIQNNYVKKVLTDEQLNAIDVIDNVQIKNQVFLLHGITGSGKTEVYLRLIEETIEKGKSAIMLVPEISLTAQIVDQFYERFGDRVAVFHSGLSAGEKYDEYLKIYNHQVKVVVGTRSAIFVPLDNLGIIIIDEEHSDSYKQNNNPRYHVLDIAKFRSAYHQVPLILGSATPTLESMARAKKGIYTLIEMKKRIGVSLLPNVELIDMAPEMKKRNLVFSDSLKTKINDRLDKKEQIILLLNRRGFSTIVTCQSCGYTYECPSCGITLTYHKTSNMLRCHYCGYQMKKTDICPKCHEESIKDYGLGTEKLETEIRKRFPSARVVRMDSDTTSKKGAHGKIISDFKNNEYDILIGTQMIAKGLDFPKVSLVGVINADMSLKIPDFRSNERTFQLLNQVSGRAGRDKYLGEVILQTFNPDNKTLNFIKNNDYEGFYQYEMNLRKQMSYPPYYYLISIKVASKDYNLASIESNKIVNYLKEKLGNQSIVLGPTTAAMFRVNNIYRFQIILKYKNDNQILGSLKELDNLYIANSLINLEIDISPSQI